MQPPGFRQEIFQFRIDNLGKCPLSKREAIAFEVSLRNVETLSYMIA